jgi:hypothetical protein
MFITRRTLRKECGVAVPIPAAMKMFVGVMAEH